MNIRCILLVAFHIKMITVLIVDILICEMTFNFGL